jgi:hypothetical protein
MDINEIQRKHLELQAKIKREQDKIITIEDDNIFSYMLPVAGFMFGTLFTLAIIYLLIKGLF